MGYIIRKDGKYETHRTDYVSQAADSNLPNEIYSSKGQEKFWRALITHILKRHCT